jgi:hypothetical protein
MPVGDGWPPPGGRRATAARAPTAEEAMATGGRNLPPHHHHHHEHGVGDRGGDSALLVLPAWSLKAAKEAASTPLDPHCS